MKKNTKRRKNTNKFQGSKKYEIKHTENPRVKIVKNSVYGVMKKDYSRNQKGR